ETQDIALVPATAELDGRTVAGFNVLVGGKNGSGGYRVAAPLGGCVRPEEAAEACSAAGPLFRRPPARDARNQIPFSVPREAWGEARVRDTLEARLGRALERAGTDARLPGATNHVGIYRQKDISLSYVGLAIPVGRITSDQLKEVARLADAYGTGEVRLTPD